MCVVLVDGGGAKAVQNFVSLKIAAISVLAVILHPAWPCPFYTPAELAERPRRFRNSQCFYPPAVRLSFFLTKSIVGTACRSSEGRRPCLGRPSRRSLARAEGPV